MSLSQAKAKIKKLVLYDWLVMEYFGKLFSTSHLGRVYHSVLLAKN